MNIDGHKYCIYLDVYWEPMSKKKQSLSVRGSFSLLNMFTYNSLKYLSEVKLIQTKKAKATETMCIQEATEDITTF